MGGAFALMASASARIRDHVSFVSAYAPYASMWTLGRDIVSATRWRDGAREPWDVDPLTRKVFEHTMEAMLDAPEARARLLAALDPRQVEQALSTLPSGIGDRLNAMSPIKYVSQIHAPLIVLLHDRDDPVIPVSESRSLRDALADHRGVHYTEFTVFKHLDPTKSNPKPLPLARELVRFARAIYPLFEQAVA